LVYLQNSGLGNAINPLMSLADSEVYGIPMILMIGWRGQPGITDEPQHIKQGRVSEELLNAMEIPYKILSSLKDDHNHIVNWATNKALETNGPVAILVEKNTFDKAEVSNKNKVINDNYLKRERAIELIIETIPADTFIVSSTGMISRELYECRERNNQGHSYDFLTVGSMGYSSQIALGIALSKPDAIIVCLDGDGSLLMHMGGISSIGTSGLKKYNHIILNNGVHDSVGGQPTLGYEVNFTKIAKACNYKNSYGPLIKKNDVIRAIDKALKNNGPNFIEINVKAGSRPDLGRPKSSPIDNKKFFIDKLNKAKK